jgi:gas vesicle protein
MGAFIFGGIIGVIVGGIAALLGLPKSGRALRQQVASSAQDATRSLRATAESALPSDPVAESIAQGKAAARRRLDELGLGG